MNGLGTLMKKSTDHKYMGFFLAPQLYFIGLYIYPYASTTEA